MGKVGHQVFAGFLLLLLLLDICLELFVCLLKPGNIRLHEVRHGVDAFRHICDFTTGTDAALLGEVQVCDLLCNGGDLGNGIRYQPAHAGEGENGQNHHHEADKQ